MLPYLLVLSLMNPAPCLPGQGLWEWPRSGVVECVPCPPAAPSPFGVSDLPAGCVSTLPGVLVDVVVYEKIDEDLAALRVSERVLQSNVQKSTSRTAQCLKQKGALARRAQRDASDCVRAVESAKNDIWWYSVGAFLIGAATGIIGYQLLN